MIESIIKTINDVCEKSSIFTFPPVGSADIGRGLHIYFPTETGDRFFRIGMAADKISLFIKTLEEINSLDLLYKLSIRDGEWAEYRAGYTDRLLLYPNCYTTEHPSSIKRITPILSSLVNIYRNTKITVDIR